MNALSYFKLMLIKHSNHIINFLVRFSLSKLLCSKQGFFLFAGDRNPPQSGLRKEGISIVSHKWKVQGDILVSGMAWLWCELILSGNGSLSLRSAHLFGFIFSQCSLLEMAFCIFHLLSSKVSNPTNYWGNFSPGTGQSWDSCASKHLNHSFS